MNPVGEAGNMFSSLFDRVPAKRAGNEEDIAGSVIYLISRAGVSESLPQNTQWMCYSANSVAGLRRRCLCLYRWWSDPRCEWPGVNRKKSSDSSCRLHISDPYILHEAAARNAKIFLSIHSLSAGLAPPPATWPQIDGMTSTVAEGIERASLSFGSGRKY
jgi:hypothetical protein